MEIRVYRFPSAGIPAFEQMEINHKAESVAYTESFYGFGTFSVTMPSCMAGSMELYRMVLINKEFAGIILEREPSMDTGKDITVISGFSLDGILSSRYTLPPGFADEENGGVAGYDAITGSTETCMKHYVARNFFDPLSPYRAIPGFAVAPDLGRGRPDDKYMSRHDPLHTVTEELGRGAKLGWKITPGIINGSMVFDCAEGTDRTAGQSSNPRVVFSVGRRNIKSMALKDSVIDMRNVFYASLSGSQFVDDTYTATVIRDGEDMPAGLSRWEQHFDISASHPLPGEELTELRRLALARAETYRPVRAMSADVHDRRQRFGTDYFLGDTVTVLHDDWGVSMDAQITAVTVEGSKEKVTRSMTFGDAPVNVIQKLKRQIRGG